MIILPTMSSKDTYRSFLKEIDASVFAQPWLLDAACGAEKWDVAIVEKHGIPLAAWPYYRKVKYGVSYLTTPRLIGYLGPIYKVALDIQKDVSRQKYKASILKELTKQLPAAQLIDTRWHPDMTYWMKLHEYGFRQESRYTYRIDLKNSLAEISANMTDKQRNTIKKSKHTLTVLPNEDFSLYWKLNKASFDRKGNTIPYRKEYFSNLDHALAQHSSRNMWVSYHDDNPVGGAYIMIDKHSAYLTATGRSDDAPREAVAAVIWEAICFAKDAGCKYFDFEGSMMPGITEYFASFGGALTPYNRIIKTKKKLWNIIFQVTGRL